MLDRSKIRDVFAEALLLSADERGRFLDRACAGDASVRAEVESLLAAIDGRPRFLDLPEVSVLEASPEFPGAHVGPYKLLEEIGQGGFGVVYMAEQEEPVRRRVAFKVIKLGMDTRAVIARFEAERQALAMMEHDHIAKVFDAGVTPSGRPYFVMELVRGDPLTVYADRASLTIRERLELLVQVCRAVQHAHSKGVIHRDLKPGNVLVTTQDGRPHAKVIDFGIAKAMDRPLTDRTLFTEFRQFVGTPQYMSPEQAGGATDVDTRSDVYSLGALLYELLTGVTPFDAKALREAALEEVFRVIREDDPPPPSTRLSRTADLSGVAALRGSKPERLSALVAGDLDWIVMKAMEKDRGRRYETADALAADIGRYLGGMAVEAAPPSRAYRVRTFVRRHRRSVTAAAAAGAALVLGVVGTSIGLVAAIRAEGAARASAVQAAIEAEQSKAINDFMREVLTSVEPQNGGADVRLMDVLDSASASASLRFEGHPMLEAQVLDLLADVYNKIGHLALTKEATRRAFLLYRDNAGPDDPRTLQAEGRVIGAALDLNQVDEAERALASLLPRAERLLGPDDYVTLSARRALATAYMARGRVDEAEQVFLELHAHARLADDDHMQTRILYALCRIRQRRAPPLDDAQRLAEWDRTVELATECVERAQRASGLGSADVLRAQGVLAQALCDQGRLGETVELCRAILSNSERRFDDCHISRRKVMSVLADALAGEGIFDEPADLYLQIINCARGLGAADPVTFISNLGDGLKYFDRAGRATEGEALAREGLSMLQSFGSGHDDVGVVFEMYIAHFVSAGGRADEAEPLFSRLIAKEDSLPGTQLRARLNRLYAGHLSAGGRFEEAEARLRRATAIYGDVPTSSRDRLPDEILCGFIDLYQAWGRPEKVREYERLREDRFGISPGG